jgi:hypothetical protein
MRTTFEGVEVFGTEAAPRAAMSDESPAAGPCYTMAGDLPQPGMSPQRREASDRNFATGDCYFLGTL